MEPFGWQKSSAHLLLLSKYLRAGPANIYARHKEWEQVLKESVDDAIQRFLIDGALVKLDLASHLDFKLTVPQLKTMLKTSGVKVTGRKEQLIARLMETNPSAAQKAVDDLQLVQCSDSGREITERYQREENERHT